MRLCNWLAGWTGAVLFALALPMDASAQSKGGLEIDGDVTFLSDYAFRGISRSSGDPSIQGSLIATHDSGLYFGGFAAWIDDFSGHDAELEGFVGYGTAMGAYNLDFSASIDSFHGNNDSTGYVDLRANISRDFGLLFARAGLAFAPDNREIGGGRSIYGFGEVAVPLTFKKLPPLSLEMALGYEDFEGGFDKWDWSAGLFAEVVSFELGIKYTDTNRSNFPGAKARWVLSLRKYF